MWRSAVADGCARVHCAVCSCWQASVYLKRGDANVQVPNHPTHQYATHRMVHVVPP